MERVASFFAERVESRLERDAQRHPLGFVVLTEQLDNNLALRYHVWPVGWSLPHGQEGSETHDHSYELNSLVILGSLRQRTFKPISDECGSYDTWKVAYSPGTSSLHRIGQKVNLRVDADDTFVAGTAYRLSAGLPHHVEMIERPAATLVLSVTAKNAPSPRVFVPTGVDGPGKFARTPLNPAELAAVNAAISGLRRSQQR